MTLATTRRNTRLFHSVAADDMDDLDVSPLAAQASKSQITHSLNIACVVINLVLLCLFLFAKPAPTVSSLWFIPITGMLLNVTAIFLGRRQSVS